MDARHYPLSQDRDIHPKTLKIAVVGGGTRGARLANRLLKGRQWNLAAVCDPDVFQVRRLSRELGGLASFETIDELLDNVEVDAIAIATSLRSLYGTVMTALQAGKHVLVEGLLADSLERGKEIVSEADAKELVLLANNEHAHSPAVQEIKNLVRTGALGEILFVDAVRTNTRPAKTDKNVFWDLAPDSFAVLDEVLPGGLSPFEVSAYGGDPLGTGRDRVGHINFRLPNDATVHLHVNQLSRMNTHKMLIAGSRLSLVWDATQPQAQVNVFDAESAMHQQHLPISWADPVQYDGRLDHPSNMENQDCLDAALATLASRILSHAATRDGAAPALRVLSMMDAVSRSRSVDDPDTLTTMPGSGMANSTGNWNERVLWPS